MARGDVLSSWEKRSAHIPVIVDPAKIPKQSRNHSPVDKENKAVENDNSPRNTLSPEEAHPACRSASPSICSNKSNTVLHDIKNYPLAIPQERQQKTNTYNADEPILSDVFTNELVAKNLRLSNQKHHRLPDAVDNILYNALQMKRDSNPGLALDVDPSSSAIGCKVFHSPGPTQCSKLKVFRPKTAASLGKEIKHCEEENNRPKTTSRLKKKCKPLSEMDLAIYWDIPASSELKNSSNTAPAVFAVVPADDYRKEINDAEVPSLYGSDNSSEGKAAVSKKQTAHTNPSAVMDVVNVESSSSPCPRINERDKKDISPPSSEFSKLSKRHISTPSLHSQKSDEKIEPLGADKRQDSGIKSMKSLSPPICWNGNQKRSKSSPNLANVGVQVDGTKFGRPCVACDLKRVKSSNRINVDKSEEYKCAFKAGKLNNYKIDQQVFERMHRSKNLRVPKPKVPFAKKNYSIGTLAPPFSIWPKTAGHDYPDHWRLASVYQHSYKPLEARKAPLIKTVFQ
ncbi:uncharacterized protein LOC135835407 [Planococcus citri]|uniref:uncharacterized protein LOC135835407 n=1 Tax=Planococcus citri TaxID=170843 RepID=UPI0031F9C372